MTVWDILNSSLSITIISFILGGILASAISAAWQRRAQRHSLRLTFLNDILNTYHEYVRFLHRNDTAEHGDVFDRYHSSMLSKTVMAKVLFGREVGNKLHLQ